MKRVGRLTLAQRIVLVVALAAALRLVGLYIVTGGANNPGGGWFGYAPATESLLLRPVGTGSPGSLIVWLVLIALWAVVSVWLLGVGGTQDRESPKE